MIETSKGSEMIMTSREKTARIHYSKLSALDSLPVH